MSDSPLLTSDGKKHLKPDPQAKNCRPHRPASSSGRPFGEKRICKCGTGLRADNPQAPRNGRRPCRRLRPAQPHNRVTAHCKALHATQPHTAQPRKNSKNSKSSKPRRHPPAPTAPPRDYPHCIRQNFRPAAPHLPDQPETYDRPIRERMPLRHERRERHERCGKAQTGSGAPTHPLRKTENGLRHGILRAAGRSGQSGLSYFSSKTAEPLMSADEVPTSASNAPFSATHSPFVSS